MKIGDLIKLSGAGLMRNKSRSILTMLGIIIGIAAVMLMLSIGKGAEGLIISQVADLGSDLVYAEPGSGDADEGPPNIFVEQTLTLDDVEELRKHDGIVEVGGFLYSDAVVQYSTEEERSQIVGTTPENISIFPADMADGRFIDESDVDSSATVAVLGSQIKQKLFGDQDPIGSKIKIKNTSFRVVGHVEQQGTRFFQNLDEQIYVPITTLQNKVLGLDYINFLAARTTLPIDLAKDEVRFVLRDSHNLDNPEGDLSKDDFFVSTQEDAVEIVGTVTSVLTLLLSSVAAISLLVGGIGIMNIMLVSVTERTREIGLRKAVGATRQDIMRQFLAEAVMLTLLGGLIGIIIGGGTSFLTSLVLSHFLDDWKFFFPADAMIYATVIAAIVGLVFGIFPARSAAKLDPIEALRYE
jgi:putative ABC transport system permease protein